MPAKPLLLSILLALCAVASSLAAPTDFLWNNPSGGDYADGSNWTPAGPPTSADNANFNLGSAGYTVRTLATTTTRSLNVSNDNVGLDLKGQLFNLDPTAGALTLGTNAGDVAALRIENGAFSTITTTVGAAAGSTASLVLDAAAGATSLSSPHWSAGDSGNGALVIKNGATMTSNDGTLGVASGVNGTAVVDGVGSSLQVSTLKVGAGGNGSLNATNGAHLSLNSLRIGSTSTGVATIDGASTTVNVSADTIVGDQAGGNGTLILQNGVTFPSGAGSTARPLTIGNNANSQGTVVVDGTGTTANVTTLYIGKAGHGELHIQNGGKVTQDEFNTVLANTLDGDGQLTVDGADSAFSSSGSITVGYNSSQGSGAMTVTNGAAVSAVDGVVVNHTGAVTLQNGTLTADVQNAGDVNNNGQIVGNFINAAQGTLHGSGSITGNLNLDSGSTIAPGNSPGTLSVGGNTDWNGGATFQFDVNSALGTAGHDPGWDLLGITGVLTLNATHANGVLVQISSLLPDNTHGNVFDFDSSQDYTWTFLTADGGIVGFDRTAFYVDASQFSNSLLPGHHFTVEQFGNSLALVYGVPEPSTGVLLALGLVALIALQRRRR